MNWWRTSQAYCTVCALAAITAFLYMAFTIEPRLLVAVGKQAANSTSEKAVQDSTALYTFWLVLATFTLAAVAALQAGLFVWQLILIRRSMEDAKRAADAATAAAKAATSQAQELRRSADATERALTDLERPWIFVEGAKITPRNGVPSPLPNDWFVSLRLRNVGRMPALMGECIFKIENKATLPITPDYQNAGSLLCPASVAVNRIAETRYVGPVPGNPNQLVFYGRLSYNELNGKTHFTGFALEISPHIPAYVGHANDAYYYHN